MNKQQIALKIFFPAMFTCATLVTLGIWLEEIYPEFGFKLAGTTFIIGLASLISWVVTVVIELKTTYISE